MENFYWNDVVWLFFFLSEGSFFYDSLQPDELLSKATISKGVDG